MRVNPDTTANLLSNLASARISQENALRQLSSGRRASLPSDDPAAIAALTHEYSRIVQNDQFTETVSSVRDLLGVTDDALNSVVLGLQRAITLGVEGANGTQSASNRIAIAADVAGISRQILGTANTTYRGIYLFAGTSATQPYIEDTAHPGVINYVGNDSTNEVKVTESQSLAMSIPGSRVFTSAGSDVFEALEALRSALVSNDTQSIQDSVTALRRSFDQVTAARAASGNRMQQLDSCKEFLDAEQLNLKTRENLLVGADPAEAATNLAQAQFAREATLQAMSRQSRMSLLDYLQ